MKTVAQLIILSMAACPFSSCNSPWYCTRQKIPIDIQAGKTETVTIHTTWCSAVGIRFSPAVWNTLTNGTNTIRVRLNSSNKKGTEIGGVNPGGLGYYGIGDLPNTHHLFYINGDYHTKASVEIIFPSAPAEATRAEIIVYRPPEGL